MAKLILLGLIAVYVYGVVKFWRGFHRTNFNQGRVYLALLWPVLLLSNQSYRKNFQRALRG